MSVESAVRHTETPLAMAAGWVRPVGRFIGRHKITSGVVVVFAAAVIVVSLLTTGGTPPKNYGPAPAFSVAAVGKSGRVSLAQYAGKPLIVNFWASWCEPCQRETPMIASWYKQERGHVALVGIDVNDTTAKALQFAAGKGVTYPIGGDPNDVVTGEYNAPGLPATFFLNAKHQIVDRVYGQMSQAELLAGVQLMDAS